MKNINTQTIVLTALLVAGSTAYATQIQTPSYLTALNDINQIEAYPLSGLDEDHNDGEARIWDAKLIDLDGDGIPDEDRRPSSLGSAGMVVRDNGHIFASAFVVGRRHVVTVAHAFARNGRLKPGHDNTYIQVEACGNQRFPIAQKYLRTFSPEFQQNLQWDYAVLELDGDLCPEVEALPFGSPEIEDLRPQRLAATGYYSPDTIGAPAQQYAPPSGSKSQYTSLGFLTDSAVISGQRLDLYRMGQSYGGSGGPITTYIDGRTVVVGMQFRESGSSDFNHNFSIAAEGPFLDFVRQHVPDLAVYSPG